MPLSATAILARYTFVILKLNQPGHSAVLHVLVSLAIPSHFLPPCAGGGLVQVLLRDCTPPPHVTLQFVHSDHSVQFPSTVPQKQLPCYHSIIELCNYRSLNICHILYQRIYISMSLLIIYLNLNPISTGLFRGGGGHRPGEARKWPPS